MTKTPSSGIERRASEGFRALGVPADLCDALADDGITDPFVQEMWRERKAIEGKL